MVAANSMAKEEFPLQQRSRAPDLMDVMMMENENDVITTILGFDCWDCSHSSSRHTTRRTKGEIVQISKSSGLSGLIIISIIIIIIFLVQYISSYWLGILSFVCTRVP
jgi:hypothetical protein